MRCEEGEAKESKTARGVKQREEEEKAQTDRGVLPQTRIEGRKGGRERGKEGQSAFYPTLTDSMSVHFRYSLYLCLRP